MYVRENLEHTKEYKENVEIAHNAPLRDCLCFFCFSLYFHISFYKYIFTT